MKEIKKNFTILMAEDDQDDCMLVQEAISENQPDFHIHFVENGEDLMDYLYHRGKYGDPALSPPPDLILLDLNMPRKDGREAMREIKNDPKLRCIPIVVLTTSQEERDILLSYNLGASSFITKPVTFQGLVDLMGLFCKYWFCIVELPRNCTQ